MSAPEHPYQADQVQPADESTAPPAWYHAPAAPHPGCQPQSQQAWNSPVSQQAAMWPAPQHAQQKSKAWLWILLGALGALAMAVFGFFLFKTGADPLRTLEEFPIEAYLRNYESVLSTRFRADLILDADLGAELGKGRLFSFRSPSSGRILPILILENSGQSTFEKGQRYQLEVEVRSSGVICAISCHKS